MTPHQLAALDIIRERITVAGFAPTIREIGDELRLTVSGAHRVVSGLVASGRVRRIPAKTRGLDLADQPDLRAVDSQAMRNELARRGETLTALSRHEPRAYHSRAVTCAADSCQLIVQRGHLFCRRHWFALPRDLREQILTAFGRKDVDAYQHAVWTARELIDSGKCG